MTTHTFFFECGDLLASVRLSPSEKLHRRYLPYQHDFVSRSRLEEGADSLVEGPDPGRDGSHEDCVYPIGIGLLKELCHPLENTQGWWKQGCCSGIDTEYDG